jgi:hypothetical protein
MTDVIQENPQFTNPYKPGAGHMPPHLAGREAEYAEFDRLLGQSVILENLVLTGLRGVGKTVLMETFKPRAVRAGWLWVGTDMSESASVSELNLALRLLADLSVVTSQFEVASPTEKHVGFRSEQQASRSPVTYEYLVAVFEAEPGLISDKLKGVLEFVSKLTGQRIIFAYDEAQNLADNAVNEQFPLSVLLDVFQSIQRKNISFMLVLTGLPTLFPKLVDARTYAERMFRVVTLGRLSEADSKEAITKPIETANCPVNLSESSVETICAESGGYPYFIQFICREVYDLFIQQSREGEPYGVPVDAIQRKLDADFFAGRWSRVSDRQRDLLWVISNLEHADTEFSIQEIVNASQRLLTKSFSSSHASQILARLSDQGLIYKNRFGKYSFAVPLMGQFILRNYAPSTDGVE